MAPFVSIPISKADSDSLNGCVKADETNTHKPGTLQVPHVDVLSAILLIGAIDGISEELSLLLKSDGHDVEAASDESAALALLADGTFHPSLVLVDQNVADCADGVAVLASLRDATVHPFSAIILTDPSDVITAVSAMRAGVSDFIEKPVAIEVLLASIDHGLVEAQATSLLWDEHHLAAGKIAKLTARQFEVLQLVLAGHPNKNIATDLHISQRTVESHRASIMHKTATHSLPELARLAVSAHPTGAVRATDLPLVKSETSSS